MGGTNLRVDTILAIIVSKGASVITVDTEGYAETVIESESPTPPASQSPRLSVPLLIGEPSS